MSKIAGPSSCNLSVINSTGARAHHLLKSVNRPITSRQRNRFHMNVISAKRHARVRNLPRSTTDVGVTDRHVPQRVRCVEGLIRTVLSVLRVVLGLPTTQGRSLITLLAVNYLITLSLPGKLGAEVARPMAIEVDADDRETAPYESQASSPTYSERGQVESDLFLVRSQATHAIPKPRSSNPSSHSRGTPIPSKQSNSSFPYSVFPLLV